MYWCGGGQKRKRDKMHVDGLRTANNARCGIKQQQDNIRPSTPLLSFILPYITYTPQKLSKDGVHRTATVLAPSGRMRFQDRPSLVRERLLPSADMMCSTPSAPRELPDRASLSMLLFLARAGPIARAPAAAEAVARQ
jgi:hypothetical protein